MMMDVLLEDCGQNIAEAMASAPSSNYNHGASNSNSAVLTRSKSLNIDTALANELFDHFCTASTLKSILKSYRYMCEALRLKPGQFPYFYPRLKSKLTSWRAQAIWSKLDKRAAHKVYKGGKVCAAQHVLVIGSGPCGLRTAIEAQLLGAKVVVMEKRDRFSRNNVLHIWPYNIHDLRGLGAKKFYGKFCAGSIEHISIRQLQCILLKVCLLLGVEVFENVSFDGLIEPQDTETGWKASVSPIDHPLSQYEFDVLVGADGKRNTLHGFKRKEFRGKLAIAITANYINRHTEAESRVEEISGVAFIFNQKFFNDLNEAKGISLENIVYYKDETHYFVMTAKKQSLLNKGVIHNNEPDTAKLLAPENINQEALFDYAREACDFATNYTLPKLEFAVNHYGKPDVAMFDFTSMFQAENSSRIVERHGHRLLIGLVGDSLLEPFWPTGTGCARGFFGGFDMCWLMRSLALGKQTMLESLAERESIYRLLNQTTPENTSKDFASYTVDPQTRYPTLNKKLVLPFQVMHLVDTDNPGQLEDELKQSSNSICRQMESAKKKRRRESQASPDTLLAWYQKQLDSYECVVVNDLTFSFQSGLALCAIIHRYRPELIEFQTLDPSTWAENNQLAFDVLETDLGIPPVMTGSELANSKNPDRLTLLSYLSQVYEHFRRDIPAVKQSKLDSIDDDLLDSQYRYNHPKKVSSRKKHQDNDYLSIGQLLTNDQGCRKKKRRSKENEIDDKTPNKENIEATLRMNRSANKKRLQKLMERAQETSEARKKKQDHERKSIKKEERYKIIEEQFSGVNSRRRNNESISKYRENKKPKDLKRAIGKLDNKDWNIRNIESKMKDKNNVEGLNKEKVPKWSKAAFQDKFNIMKGKLEHSDNSADGKYADIDSGLARLNRKLREGSVLEIGERGQNKVAALAEELLAKDDDDDSSEAPVAPVSTVRKFSVPTKSETCHFCEKRVYVVERMSAEGKFFHRSCFRCSYCKILLRLGSYVYRREGPFGGNFFCIPHSTSMMLEKLRYKNKREELQDAENKQRMLLGTDLEDGRKNPLEYMDSLPKRHKDRLLSHDRRGSTPERAGFISMESEEEAPSIMDEDEWTDRNFGEANKKKQSKDRNKHDYDEDTSDDSVSELDTDSEEEDDDEDYDGPDSRPLTANEVGQLRKEWRKKRDQSFQDTDEDESTSDSSDSDCNYDGESESNSCEDDDCSSETEERPRKHSLPKKSVIKSKKRQPVRKDSTTETDSDSDSSTEVGSEDLESTDEEDDSLDEFYSGSATECEFTDSEGRPNPFHKDVDEGRVIGPESPDAAMRVFQQQVIPGDNSEPIKLPKGFDPNAMTYSKKYQYKTPNLSDRLMKEEQKSASSFQDFSTRRALSLKKNWVSDAQTNIATKQKVSSAETNNKLQSLMDRLSSQQKLLKPADKPSTEMQHFLSKTQAPKVSTASSIKSPPTNIVSPPTTQLKTNSSLFSAPPIYRSISSETNALSEVKPETKVIKEISIDEKSEEALSKESSSDSLKAPSAVISAFSAMKDTKIQTKVEEESSSEIKIEETSEKIPEASEANPKSESNLDSTKEVFESCDENEEANHDEKVNEALNIAIAETPEPENNENSEHDEEEEINEVCNNELIKNAIVTVEVIEKSPEVNPGPLDFVDIELIDDGEPEEGEKEIILIEKELPKPYVQLLADTDITDIYKESDPNARIARMKSNKEKEQNVVQNLILDRIKKPRSLSGVRRAPRVLPQSRVPVPPPENEDPPPEIVKKPSPVKPKELSLPKNTTTTTATKKTPPSSVRLPETPITNPEKFGMSPTSPNSVNRFSRPIGRYESNNSTVLSPTDSSVASNDIDHMDGIVSSTDDSLKSASTASNNKHSKDKKNFIKSFTGVFNRSQSTSSVNRNPKYPSGEKNGEKATEQTDASSKPSTYHKSQQSITNNKESKASNQNSKFKFPNFKFSKSTTSVNRKISPEAPKADILSELGSLSSLNEKSKFPHEFKPSHPSTPPIPLSRKITIGSQHGDFDNLAESLSENEENESPDVSLSISDKDNHQDIKDNGKNLPPEIFEKIMRRGGKSARRAARVAQIKRVRKAQEIQRQLEELDVAQKELEEKGIETEQILRNENGSNKKDSQNESELMKTWFQLLSEKNKLVRREQELMVQAKQLELEDKSSLLEAELRDHLMLDCRSPESVSREGDVLKELLEISEHREKLQVMLKHDQERYQREDHDMEAHLLAKGIQIAKN